MKIFVDESAWIALIDNTAEYHEEVLAHFNRSLNNGDRLVTHNIAVGNAVKELTTTLDIDTAKKFYSTIEEAQAGTHLSVLWIGRRTQKEAFRLFNNSGESDLSLFDYAAIIFMKRRRIKSILTTNPAFHKVGLTLLPDFRE